MKYMNLDELLSRLKKHAIIIAEDKKLPDGTRIITFVTHLPLFPFGRQNTWYPLVLSPDQIEVAQPEVEALLRHVWHAELDFFEEDNPFEDDEPDHPEEPSE
jgi:hypothetical protein